ncbi:hypothetical protein D3C84_965270 [compost metagenome]
MDNQSVYIGDDGYDAAYFNRCRPPGPETDLHDWSDAVRGVLGRWRSRKPVHRGHSARALNAWHRCRLNDPAVARAAVRLLRAGGSGKGRRDMGDAADDCTGDWADIRRAYYGIRRASAFVLDQRSVCAALAAIMRQTN